MSQFEEQVTDVTDPDVGQMDAVAASDAGQFAEQGVSGSPDVFPREYVESLRRENAKYRTRAQQYEQAFSGYDDEQREALLTYIQLSAAAQRGDKEAAAQLRAWFGEDTDEIVEVPADPVEAARQVAREEAQRLLAEREAEAERERAITAIRERAEQLGYKPDSEEYVLLLKYANTPEAANTDDPLAYGDEMVKSYRQRIIDEYIASVERRGEGPRLADLGVSPKVPVEPPRSFAEARERMRERLQAGER